MHLFKPSLFLGLLILVGCGPGDWGTATGTAYLDGKPMDKGMVTFEPVGGGASAYAQIADGAFKAMTGSQEGLKAGDYIVTVVNLTLPDYGEIAQNLAPPQYASVTTSDLKATVKPGVNTFEFHLKK